MLPIEVALALQPYAERNDEETPYLRSLGKALGSLRHAAFGCAPTAPWPSSPPFALAAAGICQAALARRDSNLVRVMRKQLSMPLETWVAMHEDLRDSPRCKLTFHALVEGLTAYMKLEKLGP